MMNIGDLRSAIPTTLPEELVEDLLAGKQFRLERIVSRGHASPEGFWYDQAEHEWVLVLQGEARLALEGQVEHIHLSVGQYVNIPAHCRHRVEWTHPEQDTIWLALFYSLD